jgi:hypothetical protein
MPFTSHFRAARVVVLFAALAMYMCRPAWSQNQFQSTSPFTPTADSTSDTAGRARMAPLGIVPGATEENAAPLTDDNLYSTVNHASVATFAPSYNANQAADEMPLDRYESAPLDRSENRLLSELIRQR